MSLSPKIDGHTIDIFFAENDHERLFDNNEG